MQLSGYLALFTVSVPSCLSMHSAASPWVLFSRLVTLPVVFQLCHASSCPAQWPNPVLLLAKSNEVTHGLNLWCLLD